MALGQIQNEISISTFRAREESRYVLTLADGGWLCHPFNEYLLWTEAYVLLRYPLTLSCKSVSASVYIDVGGLVALILFPIKSKTIQNRVPTVCFFFTHMRRMWKKYVERSAEITSKGGIGKTSFSVF